MSCRGQLLGGLSAPSTASRLSLFFPLHHPAVSRLGLEKKLGGDTARTAETSGDNSISCNLTLSHKTGVAEEEGVGRREVSSKAANAWRLVGYQSACGKW